MCDVFIFVNSVRVILFLFEYLHLLIVPGHSLVFYTREFNKMHGITGT